MESDKDCDKVYAQDDTSLHDSNYGEMLDTTDEPDSDKWNSDCNVKAWLTAQ